MAASAPIFAPIGAPLYRYPKREQDTLQAWDAGDEYLLQYIKDQQLDVSNEVWLLNDSFGALACALDKQAAKLRHIHDSHVSQLGTTYNREQSQSTQADFAFWDCLEPWQGTPTLVLMKLPKSQRLLTWQLMKLSQALPQDAKLICAGKVKEIHSSTLALFEKHFGPTQTTLAQKKTRLIISHNAKAAQTLPAPIRWSVPDYDFEMQNHANVFANTKLDIAAHLMLQHIPQDPDLKTIVDLGCGNGILSLQAARLNPQAQIIAVDESPMAVASARLNADENLGPMHQVKACVNDCLSGFAPQSVDLVLCNPPFHQQNAITDHIAWQMFCDARHVLANEGKLIVIGNRHLGYHIKLKRLFGQVKTLASNGKFVILQASKRPQAKGN